jgi:hypothetical protein
LQYPFERLDGFVSVSLHHAPRELSKAVSADLKDGLDVATSMHLAAGGNHDRVLKHLNAVQWPVEKSRLPKVIVPSPFKSSKIIASMSNLASVLPKFLTPHL